MKKTLADYPELVAQWHPRKNGDLKPSDVSYGSKKFIWWACPVAEDHEWRASAGKRTSGRGCPFCRGLKVTFSNCLAHTHPEIASQWHPTKNGNITPDMVAGGKKEYWWKCSVAADHEWQASISVKMRTGCPCCSGHEAVTSNCLATTHPELAAQWHPTKNGELKPDMVVFGSHKDVWWKCPVADDHEWQETIENRTKGDCNCPCCSGHKLVRSNCLAVTHPDIAKEWHPIKNGTLVPDMVTAGRAIRIWWKCSYGHEWNTKICQRGGRNTGCPRCRESKGEKEITRILKEKFIQFKSQYRFPSCKNKLPLPFDFVVWHNGKVCLIEYQGEQHYRPVVYGSKKDDAEKVFKIVQHRDAIKVQWAKERNVPLLAIPYWEKDVEQVIVQFLGISALQQG